MDSVVHSTTTLGVSYDPRYSPTNSSTMSTCSLVAGDAHNASQEGDWGQHFHLPIQCCTQIVAFTVMVSACSLLGTAGNIPVLLVYCTNRERRTTNTFIKALAIIDLVVSAVIMPYTIIFELHLVTSDVVCRLLEFVRHMSVTASNLTLVAIAVERYVAVCVIGHRLTVRNVNQGMLAVLGIAVVMAVPSLGIFALVTKDEVKDVHCSFPHNFRPTFLFCHFTTSILGPVLSTVYQTVLLITFFLTFIVIIVIYAIVYSSLWKRAQRRSITQSFRSNVDVSTEGEKKRPEDLTLQQPEVPTILEGVPADPEFVSTDLDGVPTEPRSIPTGPDYEPTDPQPSDQLIFYVGSSEVGECSSDEPASRLALLSDLTSWGRTDLTPSSGSVGARDRTINPKLALHRRTARMLFLCSVIFLVTWLPFWIDVFSHTHNLCLRYLFFVGNASNPLVYGIANSQFRRSFVKLIVSFKTQWSPCKQTDRNKTDECNG